MRSKGLSNSKETVIWICLHKHSVSCIDQACKSCFLLKYCKLGTWKLGTCSWNWCTEGSSEITVMSPAGLVWGVLLISGKTQAPMSKCCSAPIKFTILLSESSCSNLELLALSSSSLLCCTNRLFRHSFYTISRSRCSLSFQLIMQKSRYLLLYGMVRPMLIRMSPSGMAHSLSTTADAGGLPSFVL